MLNFLREYYAWILAPFVLTLLAIGAVLYLANESEPDEAGQAFTYAAF
jgi:hypothetical protein